MKVPTFAVCDRCGKYEDASKASICELSMPVFMGGERQLNQLCAACNVSFADWLLEGKPLDTDADSLLPAPDEENSTFQGLHASLVALSDGMMDHLKQPTKFHQKVKGE